MIDKNLRQIAVFEAMKHFKRARPERVIAFLANKFNEPNAEAFKRSVHRDLKALCSSNVLGADYYTPAGELITPGDEDQHTNLRVEYYLVSEPGQEINGFNFLKESSGDIIVSKVLCSALNFSNRLESIPKNSYALSIETSPGKHLHLWLAVDERPVSIVFSRLSPKLQTNAFKAKTLENLRPRECLVLLPDQAISSTKETGLGGHCKIALLATEDTVLIQDLSSRHGTRFTTEKKVIKSFLNSCRSTDMTVEQLIASPVFTKAEPEIIETCPILIELATTRILVHRV